MFNWKETHHLVDERVNQMDSLLRLRCVLRNLPMVCEARVVPNALPPNTPAVLCAYGASLLSQLDKLKEYSGRVVLIATARAAAAMIEEGLFPQVVVTDDSWAGDFWQVPVHLDSSWLIAPPEVDPSIPRNFSYRLWVSSEHAEVCGMMKTLGIELPSYAVAERLPELLLLDVALKLGCTKIGLVGYDFCLDAYGRFFPELERPESEPAEEVAGVDGRAVQAVHAMNTERERLQEGIAALGDLYQDAMPVVMNCARRGARIENTVWQMLNDFLEGADAHVARYPLFVLKEGPVVDEKNSGVLLEVLARLRQVVGSFTVAGRRDDGSLDALRHEIQNMMGSGQVVLVETARFLQMVADLLQVDEYDVMCRFGHNMSSEIAGDMEYAVAALFKESAKICERDVHRFESIQTLGCDLIGQNNPEFAAFLRNMDDGLPTELSVRWSGQTYPHIEYMVHNEMVPVTERVDRLVRAETDVDRFVERNAFDPAKNGLVVLGGSDWMHIHAFSRRFASLKLMVVEPWPELLKLHLEHADLISSMPRDMLVVAMDKRLDSWAIRYSQRMNIWRAEGLVALFFIPPGLRKLKHIRACYETLTEKI